MKESPIFIQTYEMVVWLLGRTGKFPRNQRFLMAKRMEEAALDLYLLLTRAAKSNGRAARDALHAAGFVLAHVVSARHLRFPVLT